MTLKEMLEAAKKSLAEVKKGVESGEKTAEDLTKAINDVKDIQAKMDAAAQADELLRGLSKPETAPAEKSKKPEFHTLGDYVAHEFKKSGIDLGNRGVNATIEYKSAAVMDKPTGIAPATTEYEKEIIEGYRRELLVADLFSSAPISAAAVQFYRESSTVEGGPDEVAEGNKKPMMSFGDPTPVTVALDKIASYMKETKELVEDAPWLANAINQRGMYEHALKVEDYLVGELMGTSGVQTKSGLNADNIFGAAMDVKQQLSRLEPMLRQGCAGQLPEIYDGDYPYEGKGCFAQAWSVGEMLRVYEDIYNIEKQEA